MRELSADSALSRALNGGEPAWRRVDHLLADLWALWAKQDHPRRAEMEAQAHRAKKWARFNQLKARFEQQKRKYGLG